jgi:hypothetical protein
MSPVLRVPRPGPELPEHADQLGRGPGAERVRAQSAVLRDIGYCWPPDPGPLGEGRFPGACQGQLSPSFASIVLDASDPG